MGKAFHPRSKHHSSYPLEILVDIQPELRPFLRNNPDGELTLSFNNALAVRYLNQAILKHFYGVAYWDIPPLYLCPPVPGRADYIHYMADLLAELQGGQIPEGKTIRVLDIGTGANCIYPLLGNAIYGWSFVATDIDRTAIQHAQHIVNQNLWLQEAIVLRHQPHAQQLFHGIIRPTEHFALSICNPPFHASAAEAHQQSLRKTRNLHGRNQTKPNLNFSGQPNELWCTGGEKTFVSNMIRESTAYKHHVIWFTSLVSKQTTLAALFQVMKEQQVTEHRLIDLQTGNKNARILAWSFMTQTQRVQQLRMMTQNTR